MKFSILLTIVTLIISSNASPIPEDTSPVASIEYERRNVNHKRDSANIEVQVVKAMNRYSNSFQNFKTNVGTLPKIARTASTSNTNTTASRRRATIPLTDISNEQFWTGPISAGSSGQTFAMDFDTGSSDTFINPGIFKSTKKAVGAFKVAYMDGSWTTGNVFMESISVGGLTAKNQAIGAATSNTFGGMSGISGVGFKSVSQFNQPPWTDTMKAQGVIKKNIIAFGLSKTKARMDIGGYSSAYQGKISYAPVDSSSGFFQIPGSMNGIPISAIIDTGTTLVITTPDKATQMCTAAGGTPIDNYNGDKLCLYDPNKPLKMSFTFGGRSYTMSPDSLHYADWNGKAIASIIGADIGVASTVVGDAFLRNVYAVFDKHNSRVGFAPRNIP